MEYKKIFSREIALELISEGYELVDTEKNRFKPWLSVFIFESSTNLLDTLTNITQHI
jgi:hypothetical protein